MSIQTNFLLWVMRNLNLRRPLQSSRISTRVAVPESYYLQRIKFAKTQQSIKTSGVKF